MTSDCFLKRRVFAQSWRTASTNKCELDPGVRKFHVANRLVNGGMVHTMRNPSCCVAGACEHILVVVFLVALRGGMLHRCVQWHRLSAVCQISCTPFVSRRRWQWRVLLVALFAWYFAGRFCKSAVPHLILGGQSASDICVV